MRECVAVIAHNPGAAAPFLFLGDHASWWIPDRLDGLGLSAIDRRRHIAWDIGVDGVGRRLAQALSATFIAQTVSRLVIDCNRNPARPDAICEASDGSPVPGNVGLSTHERARRISEVFDPYHAAISAELDRRAALGLETVVVALHSFTPVMGGHARPWAFGVLHMGQSPFSQAMLAVLRAEPDAPVIGDNEPYRMDEVDYTVPRHAIGRGLDYLELEIRQDLIVDEHGQDAAAARLARLLPEALGVVRGI